MYWPTIKKLFNTYSWFFFAYLIALIIALILQFEVSQFNISIWVNSWNNGLLDAFFKYITYLGDGFFAVVVVIAILIYKRNYLWSSTLCFSIPALVTQFLKRVIFTDHLRPSIMMKDYTQLHYVTGINMHEFNSFPSGHTTSAFAVFLFLHFVSKKKRWGIAFFLVAALTGVSRIYLLQHFFQDVLVGSFIGVVCCTLIYTIFETKRAELN
jgi:membrane-associated phospholipid phosphatase